MTEEITVQPFFDSLVEVDLECLAEGREATHIAVPAEDQTIGLSVDKDYVNITGQYYGSEEVDRIQMTRKAFSSIAKMYQTWLEVQCGD